MLEASPLAPLGDPAALLDALLDAPSEAAHASGLRVLQGHRFGATEAEHVSALLRFMDPPQGATVLDIGCGFGEVARLMRAERPDLAFILLNRNAVQMRYAPRGDGFRSVLADMHSLPLAAASVDGAMFNYALCHADQPVALAEAARVVRPGGFLFIYDFERLSGDNALMEATLHARAHSRADFLAMASAAGWAEATAINPAGDDAVMRDLMGDQAAYTAIFSDLRPVIWKLTRKDPTPMPTSPDGLEALRGRCLAALNRHQRIAMCVSGGKDSLACVYLLRDHLHRITLYHLDTGDLLPEVAEAVQHVKAFAPHFVHIRGDVNAWIVANGLPTDLLPDHATPAGAPRVAGGARLTSRYTCCYANLMLPLWERIVADGNTLVIRGTKTVDLPKLPVGNGEVRDGIEFLLPIQDWSHAEVFAYLRSVGAPISRIYEHVTNAPECARCPAWLGEKRAAYLKQHYPALATDYRDRLHTVFREIDPAVGALAQKLAMLEGQTP